VQQEFTQIATLEENAYIEAYHGIFKKEVNFKIFNFGGSSMQSIAKYFLSFGAETKVYQYLKYHKLPFL
jgi:hypothetical protein